MFLKCRAGHRKYLWIEFILNPTAVRAYKSYIENPIVKDNLIDALSWYIAFRWILPKNTVLEELHEDKIIQPYMIKLSIYREKRRNSLKVSSMHDYAKFYIEKIENHARLKNEQIKLLLISGLAMSFYEIPRYTIDIDAEIKCSEEFFF